MLRIAIVAQSLDGFIARTDEPGTKFTSEADKQWFTEAIKDFPVKIMGRKTFEVSKKNILKQIKQGSDDLRLVLTRNPGKFKDQEIPHRLHFTSLPPRKQLQIIQEAGYRDSPVAILGGKAIYSSYLKAGLIDEFWVTLEPQIFGSGTPLVEPGTEAKLSLKETITLGPATLLLKYACLNSRD